MPNKQHYDINAEWDDPFEQRADKRVSRRFKSKYKIKVSVPIDSSAKHLVGLSVMRDLSLQGARIQTKHEIEAGQRVNISVPTGICPKEMGMPRSFWGPVEVRHVHEGNNDTRYVGVRFGESFLQDMEFARFVEHMQSVSSVLA